MPFTAHSQADSRLGQLTVSLWPEFDQPAVLVIYQAELPADIQPPALVELPLPAGVSAPHAVANGLETGELVIAEYQLVPAGAGQVVQITAETNTVWLEFYQDLNIAGDQRSFNYQWPGTIAVDQFSFEVQQPIGTQAMELQPAAQGQRVGSDGLTYLTGSFGSVGQDEQLDLSVSYQKSGDQLTVEDQSQLPQDGLSFQPPETQSSNGYTLPAFIGLGLALFAAVGYFMWRRARPRPVSSRRRRRTRSRPQKADVKARFCHNCGQKVGGQDRFCRNCGTEQRTS